MKITTAAIGTFVSPSTLRLCPPPLSSHGQGGQGKKTLCSVTFVFFFLVQWPDHESEHMELTPM